MTTGERIRLQLSVRAKNLLFEEFPLARKDCRRDGSAWILDTTVYGFAGAWNIAIGLALSFSYILFMKFSEMFVYTGALSPGVALWLPNLLFAIIAAVLYKLAPK